MNENTIFDCNSEENLSSYNKKILFTGYYFNEYSGSMMLICEIAQYFKKLGYEVYIAAVEIKDYIAEDVKNLGLNIYYAHNLPIDICYDIVWAYHSPILIYLMEKGLNYKKIICGCLSGLLIPLELPNLICFKNNIPIYVNSSETKEKITKLCPELTNKINVLINFVPDSFFEYKKDNSKTLNNIAIVSNHAPQEVVDAVKILKKQKINVNIYGGENNIKITPQILIRYDVVVTIGKTVQYSLALGIPVFEYDYLGGSGYITPNNIDEEEYYNFSGRSHCRKLSALDIVSELKDNYEQVVNKTKELKQIAKNRYSLSKNIDKVINDINKIEKQKIELDSETKLYSTQIKFCLDEIFRYKLLTNKAKIYKKYYFNLFLSKVLLGNKRNHCKKIANKYYEHVKYLRNIY